MAQQALINLPAELITEIFYHLLSPDPKHLRDYQNFRETCKTIAEATSSAFKARFFRIRYVMLEKESLLNLVNISRHHILSQAVEVVELCVDHLIQPKDYMSHEELEICGLKDEYDFFRVRNGEVVLLGDDSWEQIIQTYKDGWQEQTEFFSQRQHMSYLAIALTNLKNCKAIGISDHTRPWGAFKLGRRIGVLPNRFISDFLPNSMVHALVVIRTLFFALIKSRLPIEEIYIEFGDMMEGCTSVIPRMLSLPSSLAKAVKSEITTITKLSLVINPKDSDNHFSQEIRKFFAENDPVQEEKYDWQSDFHSFSSLFPALTDITLFFNYCEEKQQFPGLSESLYIPLLQRLCLEYLDCTRDELLTLLRRHQNTLRRLTLENVKITTQGLDAWSFLIQTLQNEFRLDELEIRGCGIDDCDFNIDFDLPDRLSAHTSEEMNLLQKEILQVEEEERLKGIQA
ncbi:uncharacterized protein CTRU02_208391 [Colletotrichum truncatum]|uniref:Uncharacterized protein n=6 Tax=Colletotrichum truncatum TaxID=5467 RepID=A0ACC3YWB0_COLTU|nr:uncharacterized protein CTRU02_15788 [Colletotrichum truncatum]XP_036574390.1 uncharacterized protein CTRU02_15649 [Colletotrichum truncatum]XP_036576069.1 uncharacterized protein CTRU02_13909 [Colletotrichum truncatum]KAF6780663.1 hypothetical protein CTRU02_15788 [Colletotrichum truncatum]KAF6780816.1 hypothetical protein CTRU02_15649 [Colletotrichum truncatum]KAF6782752.1 hypothetical protein CTRU02_13909 [Colletotrichum truncatum]